MTFSPNHHQERDTGISDLEQAVGDIYSFLYGTQGRRGQKIFQSFATALQVMSRSTETGSTLHIHSCINAVLTALEKLLENSQTAAIDAKLHPIVDAIQGSLDAVDVSAGGTLEQQAASMSMLKVRRHLNYGASIPVLQHSTSANNGPLPTFDLAIEGPGTLAAAGPRHNNDQIHIQDIKILPTAEEIVSQRAEYLPTRDSTKWHMVGMPGLLDQQFRLLREDTVGQLRDSVRTVLEDMNTAIPLNSRKMQKSGARVHKYQNVALANLYYNKRKKILEVMTQFDQPTMLLRKSKFDRQRWWSDCRQLQADALVCLIDSDGNTLFFSVAERGVIEVKTQAHTEEGLEDHKISRFNLWDDPQRAAITLRLIDIGDQDFASILGKKFDNCRNQLLVEFPGVLLPSFQPILEALQRMSVHGNVPFSEQLVSSAAIPLKDKQILSPPYTKQPGFAFDLSSITKDNYPLHLIPSKAFDIQSLTDHSTMDEAQCKAFVGALCRRVGLVPRAPRMR